MSDWNPVIVSVEKIEKHPNADALSIVTVLNDYPVITKLNEYKVGDLVGYIPIDSIVPDESFFYFLCPKAYEKYEEGGEIKQRQIGMKYPLGTVPEKYRIIKAKKIRNVYSQGMLVDMAAICPNYSPLNLGAPIADILHLTKYEEEEEDNIINAKKSRGANAEKAPQGWAIPYYDIESLRKYITYLHDNEEIVLTEKLHGSNAGFCHDGNRLWVKSRNFYKKMDPDDPWWDIAIRYELAEKLAKFPMMVFFGELYGSVKGFRYDCQLVNGILNTKIRFFDIFDANSNCYLNYDSFKNLICQAKLEAVPELYRGEWLGKEAMYPYAEGLTTLGGKHVREGFVLRTIQERFEPKLDARMQIKLVGEGYNLQK